ncbi:hypothetical protein UM91_03205 [Pseudomonas oryzihabitans]|nr:hypothetical protein UM91_03205 [Pseudomonas oryzihabitans]
MKNPEQPVARSVDSGEALSAEQRSPLVENAARFSTLRLQTPAGDSMVDECAFRYRCRKGQLRLAAVSVGTGAIAAMGRSYRRALNL